MADAPTEEPLGSRKGTAQGLGTPAARYRAPVRPTGPHGPIVWQVLDKVDVDTHEPRSGWWCDVAADDNSELEVHYRCGARMLVMGTLTPDPADAAVNVIDPASAWYVDFTTHTQTNCVSKTIRKLRRVILSHTD